MFRSRKPVSPRILLVLGLALCALPGCGGGGSGSIITTTTARTVTQTFQGDNTANGPYALEGLIDTARPLVVAVGGVPLVQGTDYSVDATLPNVVRINQAVPTGTPVLIQYTTLAAAIEQFNISSSNVTKFTLSQPADLTRPVSVHLVLVGFESSSSKTLTPQEYAFDANNSAVLRLTQAPTLPATLTVTYVPLRPLGT